MVVGSPGFAVLKSGNTSGGRSCTESDSENDDGREAGRSHEVLSGPQDPD